MNRRAISLIPVFTALTVMVCALKVRADVIRLQNGGEVRGKFAPDVLRSGSTGIEIETLSGAVVVVGREHLDFIARRPIEVEEYETRAKLTPGTIEAQWELADWCLAKSLDEQRDECLLRIVEMDPEDEKAHEALGHRIYKGKWMSPDEIKRAQGFVKHKGRYITTQEFELLKKTEAQRELEREWYKKIRVRKSWLSWKTVERRRKGFAELKEIDQPEAVPALKHFFRDEPNKSHRELYVSILSRIPGESPVEALVEQSLVDPEYTIRYQALDAIVENQFETAAEYFIDHLSSERNYVICRAAVGLSRVGGEEAVPRLIDALVTTHTFRVRVPDTSNTYTFGSDGSVGSTGVRLPPEIELQLRTGQLPYGVIVLPSAQTQRQKTKVITVKRTFRNSEVLAALKKFTGTSFGYDKRSWKLWLEAKNKGLLDTTAIP